MPLYEVEQYEVWTTKYRIEANSAAEAALMVFDGKGEGVDNSMDYVEACNAHGIDVLQDSEFCEAFVALGGELDDDRIPSIRSVEEI